MKNIIKITVFLFTILISVSCEKEFANINEPSEDKVLKTKTGLLGVATGMTQHFATSTLAPIVEVPGLTTREFGNLSTYVTPAELVLGGTLLNNDNTGITRLWDRLLRDKGMAESILANVGDVDMPEGTKLWLTGYSKWFKAMTLGYLIQNFEKAPINNASDGNALFSSRDDVLKECIELLKSAKNDISKVSATDEFKTRISTISLPDVINAFLARYQLLAGEHLDAIASAKLVDLSKKSEWTYDGTTSKNPIWSFAFHNSPDTKPQDNFGLTGTYIPEANDGRISFYLTPSDEKEKDFGLHGVETAAGFFNDPAKPVPVYLPGEMLLIQAEAYAMENQLGKAVEFIDKVREKKDDIYGVNANLGKWEGDKTSKTAILNEIFKNRSIELFMTGMRLEDSRRIHSNLSIPKSGSYTTERNRNYYPYPFDERENNDNIPNDPEI